MPEPKIELKEELIDEDNISGKLHHNRGKKPVRKTPSDVYMMYSFEDVYTNMMKLEKKIDEINLSEIRIGENLLKISDSIVETLEVTTKDVLKTKQRLDRLEAVQGDLFTFNLEELKERRDNGFENLELPISETAKAQLKIEIVKIERLIDSDMKKRCPECNTIQSRFGTGNFCHECGYALKTDTNTATQEDTGLGNFIHKEGNSNGKNTQKES